MSTSQWNELTAQQLVRYESLFKLLDEIHGMDDLAHIARRIATQWKYFAKVSSFRMVVACDAGFQVIDGARGEATLVQTPGLSGWDEYHWLRQRPCLVRLAELPVGPPPPEHLSGQPIVEIEVLPFSRGGRCMGLLSSAARHEAFSELDKKFIHLLGRHFADRVSDILLRRQAMEALISKARRDALTGLLNRGAILEVLTGQLALARRTGQPVGVILVDIDFFKRVNDGHGHQAGDAVLTEVARRLQQQTRNGDSLGRYGGEEFLLVLYPCNHGEAVGAAERFRCGIAESPFVIPGTPGTPGCSLPVTISLGAASSSAQPQLGLEDLLQQADAALYRSKAEGRNRVTAAPQPGAVPV